MKYEYPKEFDDLLSKRVSAVDYTVNTTIELGISMVHVRLKVLIYLEYKDGLSYYLTRKYVPIYFFEGYYNNMLKDYEVWKEKYKDDIMNDIDKISNNGYTEKPQKETIDTKVLKYNKEECEYELPWYDSCTNYKKNKKD